MIFVDANVFLRFIVSPATVQDREMALQARALFESAHAGQCQLITSDSAVAEVAFILTSRNHYHPSRLEAAKKIKGVLLNAGFRFNDRNVCLRGLELWSEHSKLSLPDAMASASSELNGHELATFDRTLR